jgi:hypothetical protein
VSTDESGPARPADPLRLAVREIEAHVEEGGWDTPPRLFALASTADLLEREPQLARMLGVTDAAAGALTPIEQEELPPNAATDLARALATIAWPDEVVGCALAHEALVLPPAAEAELDALPPETDAAAFAAHHPDRREVRLVVGVLRDGSRASCLRLRPKPDAAAGRVELDAETRTTGVFEAELVEAPDLAPGVSAALLATFD